MKISFNNKEIDLKPSDIKNLNPHFSLMKGRRFNLSNEIQDICLNNLISATKDATLKNKLNTYEIKEFIQALKFLSNIGYESSTDLISKENIVTRVITKIKHFFSIIHRTNLLDDLEKKMNDMVEKKVGPSVENNESKNPTPLPRIMQYQNEAFSRMINFTPPMIDLAKKEIEFYENFDPSDPAELLLWKATIAETLKKIAKNTNKDAWGHVYFGMGKSDYYLFDENKQLEILDSDDILYSTNPLASYANDRLTNKKDVDLFWILTPGRREVLAHILNE